MSVVRSGAIRSTAAERPDRALVVAAHPDDIEFSAAGTVARWAAAGSEIVYLLATDGDAGSNDPAIDPQMLAATRRAEQQAAAARVGVRTVEFLGFADGMLEPTLALRLAITRAIRRHRPVAVICQDPSAYWLHSGYINHPDHLAAGAACMAAIYPSACTRLAFPELLDEVLEPHRVEEVYLTMTRAADHWIDIGTTLDAKLAAWRENRSQIGVPGEVEAAIRRDAQQAAEALHGTAYAEAFTYFRLGAAAAQVRVPGQTRAGRAGDRRRNGGWGDGRGIWGQHGRGHAG